MAILGYWASQEQYSMHNLIKFVIEAEKGGFTATSLVTISIPGGIIMAMVILHGFG